MPWAGLFIALISTLFIWTMPAILEGRIKSTDQSAQKAKRGTGEMMTLLLELMDEDEQAAFKQKLQQRRLRDAGYIDDGELPDARVSLESLMQDEDAESLRL